MERVPSNGKGIKRWKERGSGKWGEERIQRCHAGVQLLRRDAGLGITDAC